MGLLDLLIASTIPILQVLLVTALGSFLATDRINILGEDARKHLNNVAFFVFNPALVASNLAKSITFESMVTLWFMPLNILFTFIFGSALGWIVIQITRPPPHLRGLILGCCAAANLGNMPLIIIPAVCKERGSPFGAPDICHTKGMAYVSLSMAIGAIYLWSYVFNIVRASNKSTDENTIINSTIDKRFYEEIPNEVTESCAEPLLHSKDATVSEDNAEYTQASLNITEGNVKVPFQVRVMQHLKMLSEKVNLKTILAPSTLGAIAGFIIGLVPGIRKSMIGEGAPLRMIQDSAYLLGDGAVPSVTLIMGGNLLKGLRSSGVHPSLIIGIMAVRYIALPLLGIVIVKGAVHFGLVPSDPLYMFVLMLQYALPPAMNIGTMTQLFGTGESECSVIMLWSYAFASIALTLWSTFFMWLVQ